MTLHERMARMNRGWLWCAVACVAASMAISRCSRQNAPTSASAFEHVHDAALTGGVLPDAAQLAAVRQATARYHDVSAAIADGYQLGFRGVVTGCISNPTAGAMGYHYFNWAKMDDPAINANDPEVLVYHTANDGTLVLGAVEWVVPKVAWEAAGNTEAPVVFGRSLHVLNPVLNWYIEHAWIWTQNPTDMFADWNPNVTCP